MTVVTIILSDDGNLDVSSRPPRSARQLAYLLSVACTRVDLAAAQQETDAAGAAGAAAPIPENGGTALHRPHELGADPLTAPPTAPQAESVKLHSHARHPLPRNPR